MKAQPMPNQPLPHTQALSVLLQVLTQPRPRLLLYGAPGTGKSHLAVALAQRLQARNMACYCLSADPGSPTFGLPGALNLGLWQDDQWQPKAFEPLCSLDAGRFRLPLIDALSRLSANIPEAPLIIDAPGVSRGIAAAELLPALITSCRINHLAVLSRSDELQHLHPELDSLTISALWIKPHELARAPNRSARISNRSSLWQAYLLNHQEVWLPLDEIALLGTPPPLTSPERWAGLMIALRRDNDTWLMGEVLELAETPQHQLRIRCPAGTCLEGAAMPKALLVRDACRQADGSLATVKTPQAQPPAPVSAPSLIHPVDTAPRAPLPRIVRGDIIAEMVNGLFDDPLLLIKTQWSRRCMLFDLGHTSRLPVRLAHNVTDVFITHAHIDHIGGFMGLLRTRLGAPAPCNIYGPPGLARHIAGMLSGVLWDRIGDRGPVFRVFELHGSTLKPYRLQPGKADIKPLPEREIEAGIILAEERFKIRAVELDHHTPVLAYAYIPCSALTVDTEAMQRLSLAEGPWLAELISALKHEKPSQLITLPNGETASAGVLAEQLLHRKPGETLVYAADLADTADNRRKLVELAWGAQTLICEAAFNEADRERADEHGHLTTAACAEIASEAQVQQLLPFHFSRRYEDQAEMMYAEIEAEFSRVLR
ncbi:hypothetical protein GCM10009104_35630 [Marinobacterium maritimum]|uniref:Uncharacterized protein n=1 Tax=Marinobacterium maritimum TaxID=500162 RepID=A0ABN1IAV0_9GAMM